MEWAVQPGQAGILARLSRVMADLEACVHALDVAMNPPTSPERAGLDTARDALQTVYDTLRQRVAA